MGHHWLIDNVESGRLTEEEDEEEFDLKNSIDFFFSDLCCPCLVKVRGFSHFIIYSIILHINKTLIM